MPKKKDKPRFKISDGLTNIYSNINTSRDTRSFNQWQYSPFFDYQETDCAYRESSIARKIIDLIPNDATRNWRTFNTDKADELRACEHKLQLPVHYNELIRLARLSGGSLMLMMVDGQDFSKPFDIKKVEKGNFKRVINFDRYEVYASDQNVTDVLSPNFLLPEFYMISGGEQPIHHSHFIRMNGEWLPRRLNRQEQGWGDSTLRKCMEDLKDLVAAKAGMSSLLVKANIDVLSMEGFFTAISSGNDDAIIKAIQAYKMGLSNTNVAITDSTSQFDRHGISVGGVSEAVAELRIHLAAAAGIPVTRFWGEQAGGMSNQQEGDMKVYYDNVRSLQESVYRNPLEKLDEVLCMSVLGEIPKDFEWDWDPLFELSSKEQSEQDMNEAQVDQMRIDQGVPVSVVMKNIQADNKYAISDEHIKAIEKAEKQSNGDTDLAVENALQQYREREAQGETSQGSESFTES